MSLASFHLKKFSVLFAAFALAAIAQADPAPSAGQNRWQVAVSPGQCSLQRLFSAPQDALLSLQTVPGSEGYRIAVIAAVASPPKPGPLFPAAVIFHDADGRFTGQARSAAVSATASTLVAIQGMDEAFLKAFSAAQTLTLEFNKTSVGPLALGSAGKAIAAFKGCIADQLAAWGADPSQFALGGTEPVALKGRDYWLSNEKLLSIRFSGDRLQTWFRVSIAVDGSIDGCVHVDDATEAGVEKIACGGVIGKAYFRPARDAFGKPVRGVATFPVDLYRQRGG